MTFPPDTDPVRDGAAASALPVLPLQVLRADEWPAWRAGQPPAVSAWLDAQQFTAAPGSAVLLPAVGEGGVGSAVLGVADKRDPWAYAHAPSALPAGFAWRPRGVRPGRESEALALGWGLASYRFTRYLTNHGPAVRPPAVLQLRTSAETRALVEADARARDWINTPAQDFGPQELEQAVRELARTQGAQVEVIAGEALQAGFPAISAVGRASHRAPRLLVLRWGRPEHPALTLVGKGVCFDTGGLDLKPAEGMRHMKKDMGGAAHALALAGVVMAQQLPVRLTLLIPAVDNAIGPEALRPGDIIRTRAGLSVEIHNTDAEGRLILGDALALACEARPDLILDFATLTGAARVALGPDLPALFCDDEALAAQWLEAGRRTRDPVWRMPLWAPYERLLASSVADLANAGGRQAGAISAALYLARHVPRGQAWAHLDLYAWNDAARPGCPAGGRTQALRAAWALLKSRYARG
ncbi:MAG: leucyl aminopeptidase family protein [Comamonas sp.]